MAVQTTIEIPEPLHEQLRRRAEQSGTSIEVLIVEAAERAYKQEASQEQQKQTGQRITGPPIKIKGKLGPAFPIDKNPHDLVLP